MNSSLKQFVLGSVLALWGACTLAATTWTLDKSAGTVPAESGWKANGNGSAISSTSTDYWLGLGVGVGGESAYDGQHSLDNQDGYETLLLNFGSTKVQLNSVSLGWTGSDSDIFVLAYTGTTAFSGSLAGATYASLLNNGWTLIGNYSNVGVNTVTLNTPDNIYSSFWLIGAGGFAAGTGVTNDQTCTKKNWDNSCKTYAPKYDYVKVAAVGGKTYTPPPGGSVPEPASLALAGIAFAGMLGMRRRKTS